MLHTPPRAKLLSVSLYDKQFLSYSPILEKMHQITPKWPWHMFKVKGTHMHTTYITEAQIFIHFGLQWAVFELGSFFQKSASNDPKWCWHVQGQKYQYVTQVKCDRAIGLCIYDFLCLIVTWGQTELLYDIRLQNQSDLESDFSRSFKFKFDSAIQDSPYVVSY